MLGTQNKFLVGLNRGIQQAGASLTCTATREHLIYSSEVVRTELDTAYEILSEAGQYPAFKDHELGGLKDRLLLDIAYLNQNPAVKLMEGLHETAYRTSLGYSLYMPESSVGLHSPAMLRDFAESHFGGANTMVIGVGVDHQELVEKVKKNGKGGQAAVREKAKYYGGEVRLNNVQPSSDIVHAAIVSEGVSLQGNEIYAAAVLKYLLGTGPNIKYGTFRVGKTSWQPGNSAASAINASYTDTGLFGFQVAAPSKDVGTVLEKTIAAYNEVKNGGITEEDVTRGKNQLRIATATDLEQGSLLLEDLAVQLSLGDNIVSPAEVDAAISKVTLADVQKIAKKVINNGKPTMASIGNLTHTPNLDQLL